MLNGRPNPTTSPSFPLLYTLSSLRKSSFQKWEVGLIFAVNKNLTGGSYKYQDHVANSSHFVQHDIEEVGIAFGSFTTSMSWPDFGTVNNVNAEQNVLRNYKQCGLFGMKVDPKVVNILPANNGFRGTNFPTWLCTWCRQTELRRARHAPGLFPSRLNKDCSQSSRTSWSTSNSRIQTVPPPTQATSSTSDTPTRASSTRTRSWRVLTDIINNFFTKIICQIFCMSLLLFL